jgi:hypothetical protein
LSIQLSGGATLDGANPLLVKALEELSRILRAPIIVNSGVRTLAEQRRLYANRASNPYPVAAPNPRAPHIRGIAVDATVGGRPIGTVSPSILARVGLTTVPDDPVHVQLTEQAAKAGAALQGAFEGGPAIDFGEVPDLIGGVIDKGADLAGDVAGAIVSMIFDALGDDGARILLYLALVLGGGGLALIGLGRMFGVRQTAAAAA